MSKIGLIYITYSIDKKREKRKGSVHMNTLDKEMKTIQGNFRIKNKAPLTATYSLKELQELFASAGFTYYRVEEFKDTTQGNKELTFHLGLPFIDGVMRVGIRDFLTYSTVRECSLEMCTDTTKLTEYQSRWLLSYVMQVLTDEDGCTKDFDVYLQYMIENRENGSEDVNWFD